ncbi:hypothetical protein, partial [Hymenobacter agri]
DQLAGRKRPADGGDVDSGPEIIAPPQALDGDSVPTAPAPRREAASASTYRTPATPRASKASAAKQNKLDNKNKVQKSTKTQKKQSSGKQPVKAHSR